MDAFELIVGLLLEEERYWIRHSVKINLTIEEKKLIGKPSAPRPEIDIIAIDIKKNTIILLEVKSYLDSKGVCFEDVTIEHDIQKGRYKLLTSDNYRNILTNRLRIDWLEKGIINKDTKLNFGLIAGKIYQNKEILFEAYFTSRGWFFWGPEIIKKKMERLAQKGYENNPVTIAAKLLMR